MNFKKINFTYNIWGTKRKNTTMARTQYPETYKNVQQENLYSALTEIDRIS